MKRNVFFIFVLLLLVCPLQAETKKGFPLLFLKYAESNLPALNKNQLTSLEVLVEKVNSGEDAFASVDTINDFNFGVLLNKMLGNLYKSHGCLHVSPRNSFLLYQLLPVGSKLTIYPYSKKVDQPLLDSLPYLTEMIDFESDITAIKKKAIDKKSIAFAVYPDSGIWIGYVNKKPITKIQVEAGPKFKIYYLLYRDSRGYPVFQDNLAYPTQGGTYYIFKKVVNYVSNLYRDLTVVPMGAEIKKTDAGWQYRNESGKWARLPQTIAEDIVLPSEKRNYCFYLVKTDSNGHPVSARWGGNTFGKYVTLLSQNMKTMSSQLVHTSDDLMMEERSLMKDIILMLTATPEGFEECIPYSENFDLYKTCYDYIQNPNRDDLIQPMQSGHYKLFYGLPLDTDEYNAIEKDVLIAHKFIRSGTELTKDEGDLLVKEGLAKYVNGKLKVDREKLYGVYYDAYQYVMTIKNNANHYAVLKDNWDDLKIIERAMTADYAKFPAETRPLFTQFAAELIIQRTLLHELTQEKAADVLEQFVGL